MFPNRCVLPGILLCVGLCVPATAQTTAADAVNHPYAEDHGMGAYEAGQQKVKTIKVKLGTVKPFKMDDKGWNLRIRFPVSVGIHDIEGFFLDEDGGQDLRERVRTFSFNPELEADIPITDRWMFKPRQELGIAFDHLEKDPVYLSATDIRFLYKMEPGSWWIGITPGAKYGFSWTDDGGNNDDYLSLHASIEANNPIMKVKWGKRHLEYSLFAKASHYIRELEFEQPDRRRLQVEEQYEVGAKLYMNPRKIWWKVRIPQLEASYRFGDNLVGFRFKIDL